MKNWIADYSVRVIGDNGYAMEEENTLELIARNISQALDIARKRLDDVKAEPNVIDAIIWNVGIVDDDVWN